MDVKDMAIAFEAVKTSLNQNKDGLILRLSIHPNDCPSQIMTDWVGTRYQVALVRIGDDDQPEAPEQTIEANRAIQSAGMLCRNDLFRRFMAEIGYASGESEAETVEGMRSFLGVKSRAEMRTNPEIIDHFLRLRDQFMEWREQVHPSDRKTGPREEQDSDL